MKKIEERRSASKLKVIPLGGLEQIGLMRTVLL